MNAIPTQPIDSRWTTEQWQAIHAGGDHVLVAAAAGSGKTAVLVQRIIRIVSSLHQPVDVDRLLVATFTKAAADEMRHRIRDALERELIDHPDSEHLRKQLALIHQSSITTLHSFCLSVVQRYYHLVPLDPGFRIANEIEAELLRQDVMEDLFEQYYSESDPDSPFWGLLDRFGGERSDLALYSLIQRMYDFSRSHPFPEEWLKHHAQLFREFDGEGDLWTKGILADVQLELEGIVGVLEEALTIARLPGGPAPYIDNIQEEWSSLSLLCDTSEGNSWHNMFDMLQTIGFGKLKPCKSSEVEKDLQEQVKSLRDQAKKQFHDIKDQLFTRTLDEYKSELMESAPLMDMLVELILTFGARYAVAKADKRLVDFSDLEHFCLKILCDGRDEDGQLQPAQPALEYRDHFVEVLLDEYQDTNQVQEAILLLISRADQGNRFMVGDVKQSIYRFRLADPGIFMSKYKTYRADAAGIAIDLARNFRSRTEIVDGVNFVFRQIMQERAAEIDYDPQAELVYGANYPDSNNGAEGAAIDIFLLRRTDQATGTEEDTEQSNQQDEADNSKEEAFELETAELEARFISMKIKELLGFEGKPFYMTDKDTGTPRPVTYRDIVILLRATRQWAPVLVEQLRLAGIPAYAELSGGYFEATEVDVMLSLLKVIDNPYQDIPISGVLRSPLVGLTAEQLACIRLQDKSAPFYEAVLRFVQLEVTPDPDMQVKLLAFLQQLEIWRTESRHGDLSELLWCIYRTTGYYDYIGGLPGGTQRQANLKALYDRARQFESTSLRGLFRFLRFIKRMQDNGGDLGAAKVMGEQEDVVRIMSIHKSKGLEFPIVFVVGMSKQFNLKDMQGDFQMHKELGFAPKIVDPVLRTSYPSLPYLAIRRRSRLESLAEEMRILYVALTRAREKLILIGSTRNPERILSKWSASLRQRELALPTYMLTQAKTYLDWIGPAVLRHPALSNIRDEWALGDTLLNDAQQESSRWTMNVVPLSEMMVWQEAAVTRLMEDTAKFEAVAEFEPVQAYSPSSMLILPSVQAEAIMREQAVQERLEWQYRYTQATTYYSKTSVTELKRLMEQDVSANDEIDITAGASSSMAESTHRYQAALLRRPKFMERQGMNAAERGTVYHSVMQHIPLISKTVDVELVEQTLLHLVKQQVIREEQREVIRPEIISEFFRTDMGQRLLASSQVQREIPFSYGLPVGELHPDAAREVRDEIVLIQGVIDCLFEEDNELVLLDFKTDAVQGHPSVVADRYRIQIDLYAKAIEAITGKMVKEKVLYFFDGPHLISM